MSRNIKTQDVVVSDFTMPKFCACCLQPTDRIRLVKKDLWIDNKRYVEGKSRYPLCKACRKHMDSWKSWRKWGIWLIGVPLGFILDAVLDSMDSLSYSSSQIGPVAMAFIMIMVYLISHWVLSRLWKRKHRDHATAYKHPVEMNLSRSTLHPSLMNYRFDFQNPGFAEKFCEMNREHLIP